MAIHRTTLLFSLLAVSFILAVQSTGTPKSNAPDFIRKSCNTTLYADVCYTTLSGYAKAANQSEARLAKLAISVAVSKTRAANTYISSFPALTMAAQDCIASLGDAVDQMKNSIRRMRRLGDGKKGGESVKFEMSNVQTWMSAALTNEGTCVDGIVESGDGMVDVVERVEYAKKLTSNALALVNLYVNNSV